MRRESEADRRGRGGMYASRAGSLPGLRCWRRDGRWGRYGTGSGRAGRGGRCFPASTSGATGALADGQREIAAVLYAGRGCVLTGPACPAASGCAGPADEHRRCPGPGADEAAECGLRPDAPDDQDAGPDLRASTASGGPLTARAVGDAARSERDLREVRALVAGAVQGGKCTVPQLGVETAGRGRRGSPGGSGRHCEEVADGVQVGG